MHAINQVETRQSPADFTGNLEVDGISFGGQEPALPFTPSFFFAVPIEHPVVVVTAQNDVDPIGSSEPIPASLSLVNNQDLTSEFVKFVVERATKSAIEGVLTCAIDNAPYWRMFFDQGLADVIAQETSNEFVFFDRLCSKGLPYSADIMDGYLSTLPREHLDRFLTDCLKRKSHPAAKAFVGATHNNPSGKYLLRVIEVFFKYGLNVDPIGTRLSVDLERAVCDGNEDFIACVIPRFTAIPVQLLCAIMNKANDPARIINLLVETCGVSLEAFADPKVLAEAKPAARDYVIGLQVRLAAREPEQIVERQDEDAFNEMTV